MNVKENRAGRLVVVEGIDGTGKSTQIALLAEALRQKGHEVVTTREPTNGTFGKQIRQLYVNREGVSREQELALFIADRREHVEQLIAPSLQQGKIVISDRYYLSTAAYQGALGFDPEEILSQNEDFAPEPDCAIIMELSPKESVMRIQQFRKDALNAFEQEEGLARVAKVFQDMNRPYIFRVDASKDIDAVHRSIMGYVTDIL